MAHLGLSFELGPNSIDQLGLPQGPKECPHLRKFFVFTKVFVDYRLNYGVFVATIYIFVKGTSETIT